MPHALGRSVPALGHMIWRARAASLPVASAKSTIQVVVRAGRQKHAVHLVVIKLLAFVRYVGQATGNYTTRTYRSIHP